LTIVQIEYVLEKFRIVDKSRVLDACASITLPLMDYLTVDQYQIDIDMLH